MCGYQRKVEQVKSKVVYRVNRYKLLCIKKIRKKDTVKEIVAIIFAITYNGV